MNFTLAQKSELNLSSKKFEYQQTIYKNFNKHFFFYQNNNHFKIMCRSISLYFINFLNFIVLMNTKLRTFYSFYHFFLLNSIILTFSVCKYKINYSKNEH